MEMNNSSTLTSMLDDVDIENGAVGRTTPIRTGAINASAISINSSIEIFIKVWNTRRHVCKCFCCVELQRVKLDRELIHSIPIHFLPSLFIWTGQTFQTEYHKYTRH